MSIESSPSDDSIRIRFLQNWEEFDVAKSNTNDDTSLIKADGTVAKVGQDTYRLRLNPESIDQVAAKVLDQNSSFWEKLKARLNPFKKCISVEVHKKGDQEWSSGILVVSRGSMMKKLRLGPIALFPGLPCKKITDALKEVFKEDCLKKFHINEEGNLLIHPGLNRGSWTWEDREIGVGITREILEEVIDQCWGTEISPNAVTDVMCDNKSFQLTRNQQSGRLKILYSTENGKTIDLTTGKIDPAVVVTKVLESQSVGTTAQKEGGPTPQPRATRLDTMPKFKLEALKSSFQNGVPIPIEKIKVLASLGENGIATACMDDEIVHGSIRTTQKTYLRLGLTDQIATLNAVQKLAIELGGQVKQGEDKRHYILIGAKKAKRLARLTTEERKVAMAAKVEKAKARQLAILPTEQRKAPMAANEEKATAEIVATLTPETVKAPEVASVKAVSQRGGPLFFQALISENKASEALKYYNANPKLSLKPEPGPVKGGKYLGPAPQNYVSILKVKIEDTELDEETRNDFRKLLLTLIQNGVDLPMGKNQAAAIAAGERKLAQGVFGESSKWILTPKFYQKQLLTYLRDYPRAKARLKKIFNNIISDHYQGKV